MVAAWLNFGQRKSVVFIHRIRSRRPVKNFLVFSSAKSDNLDSMDRCNDPSALSGLATSSSIWHPQKFDRLENHWARDSSSGARSQENGAAVPLVIQNPVNSRKLEEPIERKREYWSENLLYIMRREGLIPKNCPVVMDRPTPEEPYRLSANVVRLLEQEPDLYIAKSSIKIPSFDSEPSERSREESSSSIESWDQKPFSFSRAAVERPESFKDSIYRPSNTCCGCSCNTTPTSTAAGDSVPKSHNLFSSLLELHSQNPLYAQSRNYSTTVASKPAQKKSSQLIVDWDPVNHLVVPNKYVGSDEASLAIINMWRSKRQKKRTYENKLKMKQHLESNLFRGYRFLITGSSANGYGFDDSDVDMLIEAKNDLIPANDPISMLKGLRTHMYGVDCFQRPVLIKAICPILKFRYKRYTHDKAIQVEINANPNRVGFLNTQLLYAYSRMDPRVAPLVGACKQWGDTLNVKNAQRGTLSSYSITLMAIYFLQTVSVVPVLHNFVPEFAKGVGFREKQKLMLPYWSSTNAQNLGTLFRDMLKFYSDFDFKNYCISVKTGDALPIQDAIEMDPDLLFEAKNRSLSSRETWGFINIQEPFNLTNTARSLHGERPFGAIKRAFQRSNEIVLEKGGVNFLLGALTANTK